MFHGSKQHGYSLVEALVAVAILGALLTFITLFSSLNQTRIDSTLNNACRQMAQASLDNLRSTGFEKTTAPADVNSGVINFGAIPAGSIPPIVKQSDIASPATMALLEKTGATWTLNNYRTIIGSMTVLSAIYNSNPAFCSNPAGMNYPGGNKQLLADSRDQNLRNVSSTIRIERYDVASGVRDCPPGPIYFRPPPEKNDTLLDGIVNRPANVFENHGLAVTVNVQYTDPSNLVRSCQLSSIFQYPRMNRSDNVRATGRFEQSGASGPCDDASDEGTLTIEAKAGFDSQHGVTILCSDQSLYDSSAALSGDPILVCPEDPGPTFSGTTPNRDWVDCKNVTVCGQSPITSNWSGSTLVNRYNNIRWGCRPRVEMRLVDPALNTADPIQIIAEDPLPKTVRTCIPCPAGWTGEGYCTNIYSGCTPPPADDDPPTGSGSGGPGGGDGGGPADGGDGNGGGTDGADG